MLNNKKLGFYCKNLFKLAAANPIRMALTASGIFISVLLFSIGLIVSTSIYRNGMKNASIYLDHAVTLQIDTSSAELARDVKKLSGFELTPVMELYFPRTLCSLQFEDRSWFNLRVTVLGMYPNEKFLPVLDEDGNLIPVEAELIAGRLISATDLRDRAPVAVIDRYTAEILFPDTDPIGQTIWLNRGQNGSSIGSEDGSGQGLDSMRVIGVVEPTPLHDERLTALKCQIRSHEGDVSYESFVYCPLKAFGHIQGLTADDVGTMKWVGCMDDEASYEAVVSAAKSLQSSYETRLQSFALETKESYTETIEQKHSHTKLLLGLAMAVLCVISGLCIMSIAMFSVKERVQEIGIRKAFGASGTDIALQIILEMLLLSLIVSIVAVCVAFFICKGIELYVTRSLLMNYSLSISNLQLLLPVFVGCLTSFLCSLLPAVYAARLNVTTALKFE